MYLRYSNMQYAIWKLHLCSFYEKKVGAIFGILIVTATTYMSPVFFASSYFLHFNSYITTSFKCTLWQVKTIICIFQQKQKQWDYFRRQRYESFDTLMYQLYHSYANRNVDTSWPKSMLKIQIESNLLVSSFEFDILYSLYPLTKKAEEIGNRKKAELITCWPLVSQQVKNTSLLTFQLLMPKLSK